MPPPSIRRTHLRQRGALALLCCGVLWAAGCARLQEVEFHPSTARQYAPRPEHAEITALSSEELRERGYIYIGWITVRHLPAKEYPTDTATQCRSEAAARGGDLVSMSLENVETSEILYRTVCADRITVYVTHYICVLGEGYACQSRQICTLWVSVPYGVKVTKSTAMIWRRPS